MGAKEAFLDPKNIPGEVIEELGYRVFVGSIGSTLRSKIMDAIADAAGDDMHVAAEIARLMPEIVADSCRDPETHQRIFADADIAGLRDVSMEVLNRISTLALQHSQIGKSAVEDAAKNSDSTQSESITTS
jgi:hypothetical protein